VLAEFGTLLGFHRWLFMVFGFTRRFTKKEEHMSEEEKDAREVLEHAIKMNVDPSEIVADRGKPFRLSEKEVFALATNYPFSIRDIKRIFSLHKDGYR